MLYSHPFPVSNINLYLKLFKINLNLKTIEHLEEKEIDVNDQTSCGKILHFICDQ
jgi:hypothetical protein